MGPPTMTLWGRKVARLPVRGTLLFATDLHGNRKDYERLKAIYAQEEAAGNEPFLLFGGDLVHGPSPDLNEPGEWPDYLGTPFVDESAELIRDYRRFAVQARTLSLLGNHEHAHVGGPVLSKFYPDEAAVLEVALGDDAEPTRRFMASFPLVAVAPCGAVFTHAAPSRTETDVEAFERLRYNGYRAVPVNSMIEQGTLGALLWSRFADAFEARALMHAVFGEGRWTGFVAFGHDVVREGYDKVGSEQICLSTSYGLLDPFKVYLRLDLAARYQSVRDLRLGEEIRALYPDR